MRPSHQLELAPHLKTGETLVLLRACYPERLFEDVGNHTVSVEATQRELTEIESLLQELAEARFEQHFRVTICRTDTKLYDYRSKQNSEKLYWTSAGKCFAGFYMSPVDSPFMASVEIEQQGTVTLKSGKSKQLCFKHPWPGVRSLEIRLSREESTLRMDVKEHFQRGVSRTRRFEFSGIEKGITPVFLLPSNQETKNSGLRSVMVLETDFSRN